jgi:hypothetical protein
MIEIGDYSFKGCKNLSNVVFPSTLKRIGEGAFAGCGKLISVRIPRGTQLPPNAFPVACIVNIF